MMMGGLRSAMVRRTVFNPQPVFTETYAGAQIAGNAGNIFTVNINQIPQIAQYSGLYNQYRIISAKVMILPEFNSFEGAAIPALVGTSMPRIAYAIQDTPLAAAPLNEAQVLQDNGARVRTLKDKLVIRFRPKPERTNSAGGVEVVERPKTNPFLSFAQAGQVDPTHYGVHYWISSQLGGTGHVPNFSVYYKVTFQLRDPK